MRGGMNSLGGKNSLQQKPKIKNKIIPSSPRGARLREELLSKIVPWEKISISLDNFPYYIDEHSKNLLMECVASHLKHKELRKYRDRFKSSSQRILLQSIPGTGLYLERLVSALARELQVPLLKLDDDHLHHDEEDEEESESDEVVDTKFKKGDRWIGNVRYNSIPIEEVNNRILSNGQRGEVYEVDGERVAVVFNICGLKTMEAKKDEISTGTLSGQALVTWLDAYSIQQDREARTHDCYIAMEMLYGVLESQQPVIVYFPEYFWGPAMTDYSAKNEFLEKVKNICKQLSGVVMICPQNNWEAGPKEMEKFDPRRYYGDSAMHQLLTNDPRRHYGDSSMHQLFTNVVCMKPPKDQDLLKTFMTQIEEDRLTMIPEGNLNTMRKVLKDHNLSCMDLEHANVEDMILTRRKVVKIVGWAINHYLSSCPLPCVNEGKLHIPHESIKLAILRLKEEETQSQGQSKSIKDLATGHESSLVSAVVCSKDTGLKFDDVGGLEDVKKVLHETVILPMRRPELFAHGNLLRPCKGILLFGPPGTGKTLVAKALATESGVNFINITAATITSKCLEETENLTRALFSYARKLAPVIIFVDEADSLLGARGTNKYDTSRLNQFMADWDGLKPEERQRILVIGATNRPFDIDEAVICRMPRRIYVGLPDVGNRLKILRVLLNKENLESGFSFEQLAEATEGYSGSDLKNLCVAAAYRPVEDLLEQESKGETTDGVPALRPLNLNDFIHSKAKVRPSVAPDASSIIMLRKWNEQYGEGESPRGSRVSEDLTLVGCRN